ncbi:WxL domain-containing protein [Enterococcus sp. AZ126]|uniref:WxL domain-containing protein n=1 Tax=Enterococcus sp. AZ126 TaxID=2774635 RepID=UPI003F273765
MKKGLLATLLVSTGVLSLGLVPTNAHAADQTDLEITIKKDGGNNEGEKPLQGDLAIAWIPASMNFGEQKNTGKGAGVVSLYEDTLNKPTFLAVSDDRDPNAGDLGKWRTVVKLSDFTVAGSTEANAEKLADAQLEFTTDGVKNYKLEKDDEDNIIGAPDPSTAGVLENHVGNDIATVAKGTVIKVAAGGEAVPVLAKAAPNKEKGAYATEIQNRKLRVALPQGQAGKTFSAKLTWSLEDTFTGTGIN